MKFKVTPKDFMIFCLYCGLLLYFCAIAVLNVLTLANEGRFYGLLPFKAFTFEYLPYTIGLFIAILILIFTSVSSIIFEKDKGGTLGINIKEKSGDGYARWATEKEIKTDKGIVRVRPTDKNIDAAGIPLINKGNEMWVDNGEYHNLIIGATGSGKTETVVKPMVNLLSKKGESMVITDPKGEIYEYCGEYLRSQGYKIIILNFRDPEKGNSWNPLGLPYHYYKDGNQDKAIELLEDVALNILYGKGNSDSDFWEKSAADYFSGLALGLFMDAQEKEVNINSINLMAAVGDERRGSSTYLKEYFQMKGEDSSAYIFATNTINAPNETKGGIVSTFRQKIRQFSTKKSLSEMLAYSDFDMRDIGNEKTAVFMIIHDEKKTYHGLMTIFIKQCYETLVDSAQANGGKLKYRTNFILDEFANMPPLKDVDSMVTAARSRAIRFTFIIQNFAQLNDVYGEEVAQVIKGNCGNLVYLISTELKALEEISKMCGEVKSKEKDKTASTPLVTVSDLQKLKLFEAIIIRWRKSPFKTKLTPDFKIDWGNNYGKATLPFRESDPVQMFDIKKFVNENKKEEMFGGGMPGRNPFGGGGFDPFMGGSMGSGPFGGMIGGSSSKNEMDEIARIEKEIEEKLKKLEAEEENESKLNSKPKNIIDSEIAEEAKDAENEKEFKFEFENFDDKDAPEIKQLTDESLSEEKIKKIIEEFATEDEASKENDDSTNNDVDDSEDYLDMTQEIKLGDLENSVINVDKDSVVINDSVVSDDDYFDDFFEE